ncbi:methionyl-tRNA formyltransferase, variant 1 [Aphanomyces invadans]|uniref:methionyl-tRNA formyltransferase n=1 Tax=Aphanomyces invadans TaxID=157072 RepID=A0A024UHN4_9STRA|nr:methionyl-tRNA formyltransferase, variant 1 [Aphanomyces invadans]ETW05133.1 methionyl-tRNA formyltransferase, variant 1 [Aphanomyces invadans]|eukprot:XP_008866570.1 methionyl-tRNA formyltransferase, variant 1 [Aphanomyces invadans]
MMLSRFRHRGVPLLGRPRSSVFSSQAISRYATTATSLLRVLFFGTDNISLATLKLLHANMIGQSKTPLIEDIEIICPPDKRMGKARNKAPVPVKQFALEHNLQVHHIPDNVKSLKDWDMPATNGSFDIGVVVSFGYFIHPHMLANVRHGAINMHPSLLPKYRGPAPIPRALLHGDTKTGISVIEIDPLAFDVGRILLQKELPIPPTSTYLSLSTFLAEEGAKCVVEVLRDVDNKKKRAIVQDDAVATKAPKMKREHGIVTWNEPRDELYNVATLFSTRCLPMVTSCMVDVARGRRNLWHCVRVRFQVDQAH